MLFYYNFFLANLNSCSVELATFNQRIGLVIHVFNAIIVSLNKKKIELGKS